MSMQDCRLYFRDLQMIQSHLMNLEDTTPKHVQAQLKILNPLILKNQIHKRKLLN
ncbi:MAG: hypothetical protein ACLSBH_19620 [Coprobacillus cateniformis]